MLFGNPWTEAEIAKLLCLVSSDMAKSAIQHAFPERTPSAVRNKLFTLRVGKEDVRPRRLFLPEEIELGRAKWDAGVSQCEIAEELGCAPDTLARLRDDQGWPKRERNHSSIVANKMRVRVLWDEGLSAAAIGRELGVTKNSVVGMAHRMDLPKRPSPIGQTGAPRRPPKPRLSPRSTITLPPLTSLVAVSCASPVMLRLPPAPIRPRVLEAFGPPIAPRVYGQCCWPMGEPGTRAFRYCDGDVTTPGPYCDKCRKDHKPYRERHAA